MDVRELIHRAKKAKGSLGNVAKEIGIHQSILSEWKAGRRKPDANEIAYLAECAGLPVLETVAEVQANLSADSRYAPIWKAALGKLRAAGVAATLILGVSISSLGTPSKCHAEGLETGPLRHMNPQVVDLQKTTFGWFFCVQTETAVEGAR